MRLGWCGPLGHHGLSRVGRLAMQFGLAFVMAMMAAGGLLYLVARHELRLNVEQSLMREQDRLLPAGQPKTPDAVRARIQRFLALRVVTDKGHVLYGPDGKVVWGRIEMSTPPDGFSEIRFRDGRPDWREGTALGIPLQHGARLVIIDHSEVLEALNAILPRAVLVLTLAGCLVGLSATWAFGAVIARRLARTLSAADAIAGGDLTQRIPIGGLDGVFARQVLGLNRMIDRMADMVRSQRAFSSHLAHDLRTPLTRLRGYLSDLSTLRDPASHQMVERAERECLSIIAIFDALLRLSEIEAGRHPAALESLDLKEMVEDVTETMEPVIADAGKTLVLGNLQQATVYADTGLVQQLLVNLIENIALHTPTGTSASIDLRREDQDAVISIADNGPGIADSELHRLVLPFERGAQSHQNGSGLGLAIAQAIMRFHQGTLELGDNRPGLIVRLRFPLPESVAAETF